MKDDPSPSQFFWIGPGRFDKAKGETSAVEGVWIDRIEITSVPSVSRR